jgi:hypothetical protein
MWSLNRSFKSTPLPLIQIATLPGFMMHPPKNLALTPPSSMFSHHSVLSIFKSKIRTDGR